MKEKKEAPCQFVESVFVGGPEDGQEEGITAVRFDAVRLGTYFNTLENTPEGKRIFRYRNKEVEE